MGMPATTERYWLPADLAQFSEGDGCKYECIDGELLVTPAPRFDHQLLVTRMAVAIANYLAHESVGIVLTSPADISWGADVLVQPDVFVIPRDEAQSRDWSRIRSLLLVVEVLSPTTARADRFAKRRRYQDAGVPVYWIVDGMDQRVEVWEGAAELAVIETERLVWRPAGAGPAFTLELAELFRPV
jgi:Uma2 family endonuclease